MGCLAHYSISRVKLFAATRYLNFHPLCVHATCYLDLSLSLSSPLISPLYSRFLSLCKTCNFLLSQHIVPLSGGFGLHTQGKHSFSILLLPFKAVNMGVDGIFVSNHGARQLDTVPATIDALPSIVAAIGRKAEVYLDGGITLGTDVLKAIALGAKMVFVGRPVLWGLAYDGQKGVERVLEILRLELDMAMALAGIEKIDKIKGDFVVLPKSVL